MLLKKRFSYFAVIESNLGTTNSSHGVIDSSTEIRRWTLPDFFSITADSVDSPHFSLAGCTWFLKVLPKGNAKANGYVSVFLYKDDPTIPEKKLTYTLGLQRADGSLEENVAFFDHIFKEESLNWGWPKFLELDDLQSRKSELAPSGALTFTCRVELKASTIVAPNAEEVGSSSEETMLAELETLSTDLKDLLSSERNSDVILDVQGKEFRAHRAVLSSRSSVLRAMYEHDTAEAKSGLVRIPDCDPDSFGDFLSFLYTGKIEGVSFRTAYQLYATADKYDVQQLKDFCAARMKQNLSAEDVCDAVVLADRYGDDEIMSSAQDFFNKNFRSVILTSEWADLSLRRKPHLAHRLLKEMASAT